MSVLPIAPEITPNVVTNQMDLIRAEYKNDVGCCNLRAVV